MLPDRIFKAYHKVSCPHCGHSLRDARFDGLAVCRLNDGAAPSGLGAPKVLVRCTHCGQNLMVEIPIAPDEIIPAVRSVYDYLSKDAAKPPAQPAEKPSTQAPKPGNGSRAPCPSRRPNQPTEPISTLEVMRFKRILRTTSFKRKSKGFRRFMDRLASDGG